MPCRREAQPRPAQKAKANKTIINLILGDMHYVQNITKLDRKKTGRQEVCNCDINEQITYQCTFYVVIDRPTLTGHGHSLLIPFTTYNGVSVSFHVLLSSLCSCVY